MAGLGGTLSVARWLANFLGDQIDLHGGGLDLMFPHHENEIAQSECATGKTPFAKYWLHSGLLTINKQKNV